MTSAVGRVRTAAPATPGQVWDESVTSPLGQVFVRLGSGESGLTEAEAESRLAICGDNLPDRVAGPGPLSHAVHAVRSPFVGLLAGLGGVFLLLKDARGAVVVTVMVALSVTVRWWQQRRSVRATARLRETVLLTTTVRRRTHAHSRAGSRSMVREVPAAEVVPGDVVELVAGDVVPADVRLIRARDLLVDQSSLSGECLPVAKHAVPDRHDPDQAAGAGVTEHPGLCFAGTSVISGQGLGLVIATGAGTYVGSLARRLRTLARPDTAFDRGVRQVGWTLIRCMFVMAPVVLVLSGALSGQWTRAVLFAVAVAVGLTPEMLPVIVTASLARGASRLARRRVLVKRLNAVQDLAAVDVLCVDKTGTLTEDRVVYAHSIDADGGLDGQAAEYVHLALHFQAEPWDHLDEALQTQLDGREPDVRGGLGAESDLDADELLTEACYAHVADLGFDSYRRRATVVLRETSATGPDPHLMITRGDPGTVLDRCVAVTLDGTTAPLDRSRRRALDDLVRAHAEHGMRLLAVAVRSRPARATPYTAADEVELTLAGFVGFVDPVRSDAAHALAVLGRRGVAAKLLTGDNEHVAAQIGRQVGLAAGRVVLGREIERASGARARALVERAVVFARCTPAAKARIVALLRESGHAVGFLGDGVNDAPALRAADVGIAADTATAVAKDAADLILLDRPLAVLADAVTEGRRTLANTLKYVYITAASNFGNVLSVLVASVWLPFLPMLPIQLMIQNLLYDTAQLALPFDRADQDYLGAPRRWQARGLVGFMAVFGPLSSLFDLATFAVLRRGFGAGPALLHTGWFLEGLLTQLLVVVLLRTRARLWRRESGSTPAPAVLLAAAAAAAAGLVLPVSPLAPVLGLPALPVGYLGWLLIVLLGYALTVELAKLRYHRHRPMPW